VTHWRSLDTIVATIQRRPFALIAVSLLVIVGVELFPFDIAVPNSISLGTILSRFQFDPSLWNDGLINLFLFTPLGIGIASLLQSHKWPRAALLTSVFAISLGLSTFLEILQVFLPDRTPSPTDIATNGLGGVVGVFLWWSALKRFHGWLAFRTLARVFAVYSCLFFVLAITMQGGTTIKNWDDSFPLLLGNELTGDRPWQGSISTLAIADRVLSPNKLRQLLSGQLSLDSQNDILLAHYSLQQGESFADRTGHLPDLVWRGSAGVPQASNAEGVSLTPTQWLSTEAPPIEANRRLREKSQFTLLVDLATANTEQWGPARIVSLSSDPYHRNFTLGQEYRHLSFRLRTPLFGPNGDNPELVVPKIFSDTEPHRLAITYDGAAFNLYVDRLRNSYAFPLKPEMILLQKHFLPPAFDKLRINQVERYRLFYYVVVFVPLGALLAIAARDDRAPLRLRLAFVVFGLVFPPFILESAIASSANRQWTTANVLLSLALLAGSALTVWGCSRLLQGRHKGQALNT
jgi:glycopeptide antibiotics resistance protein